MGHLQILEGGIKQGGEEKSIGKVAVGTWLPTHSRL